MSGTPGETTGASRPGALLFAFVFLALSFLLLSLIGSETKFDAMWKVLEKGNVFNRGKLFAQPAFWPAVGLIGMCVFGVGHLWRTWRAKSPLGEGAEGLFWLRSLEYLLWFMAYVQTAPLIGYLPATLIFTALLAFRAGYREKRMIGYAVLTGLAVVLVFKTGLSVKIPGGAVYEYLPNTLRTFAIVNF